MRRTGAVLSLAARFLPFLLVAGPAGALEQEVSFDATVALEAGFTSNPRVQIAPSPTQLSPVFRPRLGVGARYGLTNSLYVGVAADAAYSGSFSLTPQYVLSGDVVYNDAPGHNPSELWSFNLGTSRSRQAGGTLYALNGVGAVYGTVGLRPHLGYDAMGFVELAVGPAVGVWYNTGLVSNIGGQDRLVLGPDELIHQFIPGFAARLSCGFDARLHDMFSISVMPYVAGAFVGSLSVEAGVALRPNLVLSPWPI